MKEINGNLIELAISGAFDAIIHGCNCYSTMGAGIAVQIRTQFPEAFMVDQSLPDGPSKLGCFSSAYCYGHRTRGPEIVGDGILVINAYTQLRPGKDLQNTALIQSMGRISKFLSTGIKIGIPRIGCGIAGGDWKVVQHIIAEAFISHDITVVNFSR